MRYVDDLSKVRPEEITTIDGREVISITRIPKPMGPYQSFAVCTETACFCYSINGRERYEGMQCFIYKKVTYVKSMKQLLEEYPDHYFDKNGVLCLSQNRTLPPDFFHCLGKPTSEEPSLEWPQMYLEERGE